MGGYGSGRRGHRGVLEHLYQLDVNWLWREGVLSGEGVRLLSWSREGGGGGASIAVARRCGGLEFFYDISRGAEGRQHVRYAVGLDWTACHYGGKRPWFICPNQSCWRRVAKLYLQSTHFMCRHCTGAAYASQNETESDRLARKARRIRTKLGADMNLFESLGDWDKPKGMHWRTFRRLETQEMWASHESLMLAARRIGTWPDQL